MSRPLVTPFSLSDLPPEPSVAPVLTGRVAAARAALALEQPVALHPIGTVRANLVEVRFSPAAWRRGFEEKLVLDRPQGPALLVVDGALALALVSTVLGRSPPAVLRALGPAERGVLAAVVVAWLGAHGRGTTVRLAPDDCEAVAVDLSLELAISAGAARGRARLDLPSGWLPSKVPAPAAPDARTPLRATLVLSRTRVPASALAGVVRGDGVVFEGVSSVDASSAWPIELRAGAHAAAARWAADGALTLDGPFTLAPEISMSEDRVSRPDPALTADEAGVLAEAPVEIVAEAGRVVVRAHELVGLMRGGVLRLGTRPSAIDLRVGDRLWARGELVRVDDELAVRITELFAPG